MPPAIPVRVIPDPRTPGHISDEFFITLTSWKAANSAFVGGFAVGWLAYTDNFFRGNSPRSKSTDSCISVLAMFSAFLSLGSAAIYGLSAAGTMWHMKVAAGWNLIPKDREPLSPIIENIAILWINSRANATRSCGSTLRYSMGMAAYTRNTITFGNP